MAIYFINIIVTAVIAIDARKQKRIVGMQGEIRYKVSLWAIGAILLTWVLIYANRGLSIGSDTEGYYQYYKLLTQSTVSLKEYLNQGGDILFETLRYCINKVSSGNWHIFIYIMGVLTYAPILFVLRKEENKHFAMSVLLYIFMFHYYYGFNAIRQTIANSISFMAYFLFFRKRKYIKYTISMLIAWGFHSTALFVVVFHFLSKLKIKSKILWVIVGVLLIIGRSFSTVWNAAISLLSMGGNDTLANRYVENMFTGSGYIRVLICLVPLVLGIWKQSVIERKEQKKIDDFLIFLIFDTIFMLYSTYNWLFARIAVYLDIYAIVFIPKLEGVFKDNSRKVSKMLILSLYFIYMVMLLLHGEANVYPYKFM